mmetsp:Transcript_96137/g.170612  ORF Transcript_96137/g.170612 Transcript_96137/m.170612 type:complete len:647 (-) Transcript_96137:63-2003(-)|eukprot:CAMPEP_0197660594 /NCGR_PEP_ID=MMETSP1338-20131121/50940_1 /TAXON_ID=43686 ORGANISM="Pelagodinium beii, Strain RCC1491" /NCGR_SAMPLE_ID=MMETSP1338 /ASSEMBLY_ACC=CAM_ASM_000754 /LENGTH=646 /DNA_ID=CAMNT_0043237973 /DNA_START=82 /DNA_END=2022 /DNA_ORIENTATION=+
MAPQEAWPDDIPEDNGEDIGYLIEFIKTTVYQRRLRSKDFFADFDNLRNGRCTKNNFARALDKMMASSQLKPSEVDALADHFTESGPQVHWPRVVSYSKFCQVIDDIFGPSNLELTPSAKVPLPGTGMIGAGGDFKATTRLGEEENMAAILHKIATLAKTRGIEWGNCMRARTAKEVPRGSGKTTVNAFYRRFPFTSCFTEEELTMLTRRYCDKDGVMHLHPLELDVQIIIEEERIRAEKAAGTIRDDDEDEVEFSYQSQQYQQKAPSPVPSPTGSSPPMSEAAEEFSQRAPLQRPKSAHPRLTTSGSRMVPERTASQQLQRPMSAGGNFKISSEHQSLEAPQGYEAQEEAKAPPKQRPMSASGSLSRLTQQKSGSKQRPMSAPMGRTRSAGNLAKAGFHSTALPTHQQVISKIQSIVKKRRVRLHDRFVDFDRLRKGVVTPSQFRTTLSIMRIDLPQAELQVLEETYKSKGPGDDDSDPKCFFKYKPFCDDVDGTLGKAAQAVYQSDKERSFRSMAGLNELLAAIRSKTKARRLELYGAFDDRCKGAPVRRIGRTTMLRVMHLMGFPLTEHEVDTLCNAFSDEYGFDYLQFCTVVDPFMAHDAAVYAATSKKPQPPTTRYFSLQGDVVRHHKRPARPSTAPSMRR